MINNRHGFSFALPIIIGGGILTLGGIISSIENPILGLVMVAVGPFFWSSSYGIQLDPEQNRFREYGSFYGIKSGKWKPLDKVPFLTIVRGRGGTAVYAGTNRSTTVIDDRFQVCLLTNSHRTRIVVQKFENLIDAEVYAKQLASTLSKTVVQFNPVVSEKTRNRRSNH